MALLVQYTFGMHTEPATRSVMPYKTIKCYKNIFYYFKVSFAHIIISKIKTMPKPVTLKYHNWLISSFIIFLYIYTDIDTVPVKM